MVDGGRGRRVISYCYQRAAARSFLAFVRRVRMPIDVLKLLERAAEIQGRTVTDFVVAAADEAACRALEQTEIIRLSVEDQRQIAEAIINPPKPTPALRRAARRYRELFGVD
jgi:uncharacterized protein (DUF1778 family)